MIVTATSKQNEIGNCLFVHDIQFIDTTEFIGAIIAEDYM